MRDLRGNLTQRELDRYKEYIKIKQRRLAALPRLWEMQWQSWMD